MIDIFSTLKGVYPLVSVPFRNDGSIDYAGFQRLVEFVCNSGVDGIGLWGMMSEYYKLNDYERDILATIFFKCTNEKPIASLVSVTDWCTEIAVAHAKEYEAKGANYLMLLPPFYYKPTVENIIYHIESVVSAVRIPVVVQYAPQSTGMYFEDSVIPMLVEKYENIAFKLEHNPQKEFIKTYLDQIPTLKVMSGYAGLDMLELLNIGVRGAMPGCSFAEIHKKIYQMFIDNEKETAHQLYNRLAVYLQEWMTSVEKLIAVEKMILYRRGVIDSPGCRHPAYALSPVDNERIKEFLLEFSDILSVNDRVKFA